MGDFFSLKKPIVCIFDGLDFAAFFLFAVVFCNEVLYLTSHEAINLLSLTVLHSSLIQLSLVCGKPLQIF